LPVSLLVYLEKAARIDACFGLMVDFLLWMELLDAGARLSKERIFSKRSIPAATGSPVQAFVPPA
jgi:hypothetical protein